ncbi:hypothetical protein [Paenibacillus illinoisensis]|nr:hypothetical protein [Paenibacillus illinoisensis]
MEIKKEQLANGQLLFFNSYEERSFQSQGFSHQRQHTDPSAILIITPVST